MWVSACVRTTSATALVIRFAYWTWSYDSPVNLAFIKSSKFLGRAKLPQWVVSIRSVLCFMMIMSPFES